MNGFHPETYSLVLCFCRMTKLLDDEVEEDEQFWNQEALKEVCIYNTLLLCNFSFIRDGE